MPKSNIELIRRLADGFSEVDFKRFRDALVKADGLDDLTASTGAFGRLLAEVIDPEIEVHLHDIHAASTVGHDFHGEGGKVTRLGMYARRRTALADLGHG